MAAPNNPNPKGTRVKRTPGYFRKPRLDSNITNEQEAYCRGRAMGMDITEALSAAGLNVTYTTAKNWEKNLSAVRDRIQELANIATKNAIINTRLDREWVIKRLMSVVDRCMQAEPVMDKKGELTGEFKFDSAGANAALKMLGDTMGMFKPAEKKPGDEYAELTDDDIARIAAELAAQTGLTEAIAGAKEAPGPQQVVEIRALPQADRVPQRWGDEAGEVVPSGEPVGEDVEFGLRDGLPPDGDVPGLVEGQEVEPGGDGLGAGRVDGIDPGHDAAPHHGSAGGVGDGVDPDGPDHRGQARTGDRGLH
jgi:phage terminase small subunit